MLVVFLSIVFASSDRRLMLLILASSVFLGGWVFMSVMSCSCNKSCILITYGGFPFILCHLVTYIAFCSVSLFIGSLSLKAEDLAQYFSAISSHFSLIGGRLHSTSRLLVEVALYAPVMMRIAAFCMASNRAIWVLPADAYACSPYSILLSISATYRFLSVFLSAPKEVPDTALSTLRSFWHFVTRLSICFLHVSLSSKIIPKNVASLLYSNILPFNLNFLNFEVSVPFGLKMTTCVLSGDISNPQFLPQSSITFNASWII